MFFNSQSNDLQRIKRFRIFVAIFFICLIVPMILIVYYGFQKFENEMLFQYRWKSSDALVQMNKILSARFDREGQRSPFEYHYFQSADKSNDQSSLFRSNISPLARNNEPHYQEDLHGLIGYFNIVNKKQFNSPLLPFNSLVDNGVSKVPFGQNETKNRLEIITLLKKTLVENGFLDAEFEGKATLQNVSPFNPDDSNTSQAGAFKMKKAPNQKLIFYRTARINQQDSVQGFVVDKDIFLYQLLGIYIRRARFDNNIQVKLVDKLNSDFSYYYKYDYTKQGRASISASDTVNEALASRELFTGELVSPFQYLSLKFTTDRLPLGPATRLVALFIVVLSVVILIGTGGVYWLGVKQIALAEQRMNFVSSVSHELKTPLTSILMYSEMLKSDLVPNKQKKYDYFNFIFDESERLSRLINNVLQLSNFNRDQENMSLEPFEIDVLKEIITSKVSTLITKNNFKLNFIVNKNMPPNLRVIVDLDAFSQIVINLVDNAVKFFNAAKIDDARRRVIDISFAASIESPNKIVFSIRDYGPGISKSQLNHIFDLFYRCGNEMTRTTSGTGIGLSLVHRLSTAQEGTVEVTPKNPGVSFDLTFLTDSSSLT